MKKIFWMMTLPALVMILAACGSPPASNAASTPAAVSTPPEILSTDIVVASAEVKPAHISHVSFTISAPVKEVLVKEGDVVSAGQPLITLFTPDLEGQVTQAELAEKSAELEFQYWIPHRYDRPPERKQQAQAEFDRAKMSLEVARATLAQTTISAPFDSTVIEVNVKTGEYAQTGQVVITLADVKDMQVVTSDLSERDVPRVKEGQTVRVYIEALDQTLTGKVLRVSPVSETVGGDVVYPVTIMLDEQIPDLLWGMSAEVEIQTE